MGLLRQLKSLEVFTRAQRVAMYLANDGEIDPGPTMEWCWQQGMHTYVPIVFQERGRNFMKFCGVDAETQFDKNRFGISEPLYSLQDLVSPEELDLVLLPLVAFDSAGNRIGMGGGFYDTTFEFLRENIEQKPLLVGIAHSVQKVGEITSELWDIPLSIVVTDQEVHYLSATGAN